MKKLLKKGVFALAFLGCVVLSKNSIFASPVLVNEHNFPDSTIRSELLIPQNYALDDEGNYMVDDNGDYYIESDNVTILSCFDAVKSLKGLELLPNIKSLELESCQINKVDVSMLTNLKYISITGNKVTSVKLGDYSKINTILLHCPNLKFDFSKLKNAEKIYLKVYNVNASQLSSLKKLKELSLYAATNKSFDFSKNTSLYDLTLGACNKLTKLSLGANSNLMTLDIYECKKLDSIDLTKCKNISYLSITDCNIKDINVSKASKLEGLKVNGNKKLKSLDLSKNKKLKSLNVGYTDITSLSTSKNTKLETLMVYNTKLSSLNLKTNKKLGYIDYSNSNIKSLPLDKLYNSLYISYQHVKSGTSIDLSNFIGKGYKVTSSNEAGSYDSKNGIFKAKKTKDTYYATVTLEKGNKKFTISANFK